MIGVGFVGSYVGGGMLSFFLELYTSRKKGDARLMSRGGLPKGMGSVVVHSLSMARRAVKSIQMSRVDC